MISKAQVQNDYTKQMTISGVTGANSNIRMAIKCLICSEYVELDEQDYLTLNSNKTIVKICPKCKQAVMKVRKEMEKDKEI